MFSGIPYPANPARIFHETGATGFTAGSRVDLQNVSYAAEGIKRMSTHLAVAGTALGLIALWATLLPMMP
jgi:hypothetical protein